MIEDLNYDGIKNLSEKADLIYDLSKDFLLNTIRARENIQKKIGGLICFTFFFILFFIHTLFVRVNILDFINLNLIAMSVEYLLVLCMLVLLWLPKKYSTTGNEPKNLLVQKNIEQSIAFMKIGEVQSIQTRICFNFKQNERTSFLLKLSVLCLIVLPIISGIIIFLT